VLKRCHWAVVLSLLLSPGPALAQPGAGDQVRSEGQIVQDLSGFGWKLKRMRPGQGVREELHELPQAVVVSVWLPGRGPGGAFRERFEPWSRDAIDTNSRPPFPRESAGLPLPSRRAQEAARAGYGSSTTCSTTFSS